MCWSLSSIATCSVDLPPPRRGICFPLCHDLRLALFAPLLHRADDGVNRSALPLLHAAAVAPCLSLHRDGDDERELNVGCPSDRVQTGRFGACLMAEPHLVAECIAAMRAAVTLPVTVKT